MLKGRKLQELCLDEDTCENLLIVNRDKAHASRRLTSRGWTCDPVLQETLTFVTGNKSLIQRIRNSDVFRHIFNDNVRKLKRSPVDGRRTHDLRSAKHRFESHQRPFGRAVPGDQAEQTGAGGLRGGRTPRT